MFQPMCVYKTVNVPLVQSVNVPVSQEEGVQSDVQLPNENKDGTSDLMPDSSVQGRPNSGDM